MCHAEMMRLKEPIPYNESEDPTPIERESAPNSFLFVAHTFSARDRTLVWLAANHT